MAFSYLTNKIGVLDLDRLYGVLDIVVDVLSIAGLALALRAPGGRKRMLVIASTFLTAATPRSLGRQAAPCAIACGRARANACLA